MMNDKIDFLAKIGIQVPLLVAGFAGALVFIRKSKVTSLGNAFFTVISGSITSNYITPLILKMVPSLHDFNYGIGFIMGYMGFTGVEFIIDKLFNHKK